MGYFKLIVLVAFLTVFTKSTTEANFLQGYLETTVQYTIYSDTSFDSYSCASNEVRRRNKCYRLLTPAMTLSKAERYRRQHKLKFANLKKRRDRSAVRDLFKSTAGTGYVYLIEMKSLKDSRTYNRYFFQSYRRGYVIALNMRTGDIVTRPNYESFYFVAVRKSCKKNRWLCHDQSKCIKTKYLCNGRRECPDGSDEKLQRCRSCGGAITSASAKISSPNYPKNYPNRAECDWTVSIAGADAIKVHFIEWDLKKRDSDYLQIIGESDAAEYHGEDSMKGRKIQYAGNFLRIYFHSDRRRRAKGFEIGFEKVEFPSRNFALTSTSQSISISASEFRTGFSKYWIFTTSSSIITFLFTEFYLDPAVTIRFYSGNSASGQLLYQFSGGANLGSFGIFAQTQTLYVQLVCGAYFTTISPRNFRFASTVSQGCSMTLDNSASGEIVSPSDANGRYPATVSCEYHFRNMHANTSFYIEKFDVRGPKAYFEFNGTRFSDGEELQGNLSKWRVDAGINITMKFIANSATRATGFKIHFSKACNIAGRIVAYNTKVNITAGTNKVFGNELSTTTWKQATCLKGGILSTSLTTYTKRCRATFFSYYVSMGVFGRRYNLGETVQFHCSNGYRSVGTTRYVCSMTGWVQQGSCSRITCSKSSIVSPLTFRIYPINRNEIRAYDRVYFSCQPSSYWKLDGHSSVRCLSSGSFDKSLPRCIARGCQVPKLRGSREYWDKEGQEISIGSTVELKCRGNYKKKNDDTKLKCNSVGNTAITNGPAKCEAYDTCKNLKPCGEHRCVNVPGAYYCVCKRGYQLSRNRRTCEDIDECKGRRLPDCHHCHNTNGSYYCTCNPGYQVYNDTLLTFARQHYRWSYRLLRTNQSCIKRPCAALTIPNAYGRPLKSVYLTGESYSYICKTGYSAGGYWRNKITCSPNGNSVSWTGDMACQTGQCPEHENINNGNLVIRSRNYLSSADLECDDGYTSDKTSSKYYCLTHYSGRSGLKFKWKGTAKCVQLQQCPSLSNPNNGNVRTFRGMAWYSCNSGFNLRGSPIRYCLKGSWSGSVPSCIRLSCPALSFGGRNIIPLSNTTISSLWFRCRESGYKLVGDLHLRCVIEDRWLSQTNLTMSSVTFCDKTVQEIGCPRNTVIHPTYAVYGYEFQNATGCEGSNVYSNRSCGDANLSLNYINTICKGKRTCWIPVRAETFNTSQSGLCNGKARHLEVTYLCVRRGQKVSASHSLLACDHIVPGLVKTILKPNVLKTNISDADKTTLCNNETRARLLGCMYFKAKVIKSNSEMLKYHLFKSIVSNACSSNRTLNLTLCLRSLDFIKAEGSMDLCSPNIQTALNQCWNNSRGALHQLYSRYVQASCNPYDFIKQSDSENLLLEDDFVPKEYNEMKMWHFWKNVGGNWINMSTSANLVNQGLVLNGTGEYRLKFKFLTTIRVKAIFMHLSQSSRFGMLNLSTAMYSNSSTLTASKFEMKYVRGDVIEIKLKGEDDSSDKLNVSAVQVAFSLVNMTKATSLLKMSISYDKPRELKVIKCHQCTNQTKEEYCLKRIKCINDRSQCYSIWKKYGSKILVNKGCALKADVAKWKLNNKCYNTSTESNSICTTGCSSDYCNGFGQCPPWVSACKIGDNMDIYNLTLSVNTKFRTVDTSCHANITNYLYNHARLLWVTFSRNSCNITKSKMTQKFTATHDSMMVTMTIQRHYTVEDTYNCYEQRISGFKPFDALKKAWSTMKSDSMCGGKLKMNDIKQEIYHYCAYGSHFNSTTGWCQDEGTLSKSDNALLNTSIVQLITISKSASQRFTLMKNGEFRITGGGKYTLYVKFHQQMYIREFSLMVLGTGFRINKINNVQSTSSMRYVKDYKLVANSFTVTFHLSGGSGSALVFLGLRVSRISRFLTCYECTNATREDQCTKKVTCIADGNRCYTTWKTNSTKTTVNKGCASVMSLMHWQRMSQCCKVPSHETKNATCTSTCHNDDCNAHSRCPVWQKSCVSDLNIHNYSVGVQSAFVGSVNSDCRKKMFDRMKDVLESTRDKFKKEICDDDKTLTVNITGINNSTHVVNILTIVHRYKSYDVPPCLDKEKPKKLKKDFISVLLTHNPIKIENCAQSNSVQFILFGKTVNSTRCAFGSSYDRATKLCLNPNVLSEWKNTLHSKDIIKKFEVKSDDKKVEFTKQGYVSVKVNTSYEGKIEFKKKSKIQRLTLQLFGFGLGLSLSDKNITDKSCDNKTLNFNFTSSTTETEFKFYVTGLKNASSTGVVTIGLEAVKADDDDDKNKDKTNNGNGSGSIGRDKRSVSLNVSVVITRDANLTASYSKNSTTFESVNVASSDFGQSSGSVRAEWSSTLPRCQDVTKPTPRGNLCNSVKRYTERAESPRRWNINMMSIWPSFRDNSNKDVMVSVVGSEHLTKYSEINMTEWNKTLVFNATDSAGNSYLCPVTLMWQDKTKPNVTCPAINHVQNANVNSRTAAIVLPTVEASDANGIRSINYSIKNGSLIPINMPHLVTIEVTDNRNNTVRCNYYHTIRPTSCHNDALPYVDKSNMTVLINPTLGTITLTCPASYSLGNTFAQSTSGNAIVCNNGALTFTGAFTGHTSIPPCLKITGYYRLQYEINVGSRISQTCCSPGFLDKNISSTLKASVPCLSRLSANVSSSITTEVTGGIGIPSGCKIKMNIEFSYNTSVQQPATLTSCANDISNALKGKTFSLTSKSTTCTEQSLLINANYSSVSAICPKGSVSKRDANSVLLCVPCFRGTFYNSTSKMCQVCGLNTYQDEMQETSCKACPENKGTLNENSMNISQCVPRCKLGHYKSERPYEPCNKCPIGNYSDVIGATECKQCPNDTTTAEEGGTSAKDCKKKCEAGTYSENGSGYEPCHTCQRGTYQDQDSQATCLDCPRNTTTQETGADSEDKCISVDPCANNTCKMGSCQVQPNFQYSCVCSSGYTGDNCDVMIDMCKLYSPCTYGNCSASLNNYTCSCVPGVSGVNCTVRDFCHENPCKHNSTCVTRASDYVCNNCNSPYTGKDCDELSDPCSIDPCLNGGTCLQDGNSTSYSCNCTDSYEGATCENKINLCASNPCQNGGLCDNSTEGSYSCNCTTGWTGDDCETDINECANNDTVLCLNDGTCTNTDGSYECVCAAGYEGANCSSEINECLSNPCKNGANCTDGFLNYTCTCPTGYTGLTCEEMIDNCRTNPCHSNGTVSCISTLNNFTCQCLPGYKGRFCNETATYCAPNPCVGGVACVEGADVQTIYNKSEDTRYYCACPDYRGGQRCERQLDTCRNHKCENGATCVNGSTSYTCQCPLGYNGTLCDGVVDLCASLSPCSNGGTCSPTTGNYTCACVSGWTGHNCSEQINECLNKPCENNGTCTDLLNDYECTCTSQYKGKNCSEKANVCETSPCKNNGTCTSSSTGGGYTCTCPSGFNGTNCENNIDDCPSPDPCLNGGVCHDLVNKYQCNCSSKLYEGTLCGFVRGEDYDYLFGTLNTNPFVKQDIAIASSLSSMSVGFWIRPFASAQVPLVKIMNGTTNVMDFKSNGFAYSVGSPVSLSFTTLSAGSWSHLLVNFDSGSLGFYVNGASVGVLSANTSTFDAGNYSVYFGNYDNSTKFMGQMSRFYWRNGTVPSTEINEFKDNCSTSGNISAVNPSDLLMDWRIIGGGQNNSRDTMCGLSTCPPGFSGNTCSSEEDNEPPIVRYCPTEVNHIENKFISAVNFREPEFYDKKDGVITNITKSHVSGQSLRPGIYPAVWKAYDSAGNEAICSFNINFLRFKCKKQASPDNNTIVACTAAATGDIYCSVSCRDSTRYVLPPGQYSFYTCSAALGGWQPAQTGGFKIPNCVLTATPSSRAQGSMSVTVAAGESCEAKKSTIQKQFIDFMKTVRARNPKVCDKADCSDLASKVHVSCPAAGRRKKRSTSATMTYSLPGGGSSANTMCSSTSTPTSGSGVSMTAGSCPQVTPSCSNGYIHINNNCYACPTGQYHRQPFDTTCTPCPKGEYNSALGATSCTKCPTNQTTPGVGATTSQLCYKVCPAGQFMNPGTSKCEACPAGSYQASAGQAQCFACPSGSASSSGSTQCKNCTAGQQLDSSGNCAPCPKGFYRPNDPRQSVCLSCPGGTTTAGTGATASSQCSVPICNAGEYVTSDNVCKKCPLGTYQPQKGQATCLRCGTGMTTPTNGATSKSQCKPGTVNECAVGSAHCHKYAKCTDTPGSFRCTCQGPNWQGDGFTCRCASGYSGDKCQVATKPGMSNAELLGIVLGCILGAILILGVILVIYYCKIKKTGKSDFTDNEHRYSYQPYNPEDSPSSKYGGHDNETYQEPIVLREMPSMYRD